MIGLVEDNGVVKGRVAVVDPATVGLRLTAFVAIRTNRHTEDWLLQFAKAIQTLPEIVECHRMSGDVDYMLKILVRDIDHYDRVYRRLIAVAPDLADVSSSFSMEQLKFGTAIDVTTA